jgi:signal transduction histidine kinase
VLGRHFLVIHELRIQVHFSPRDHEAHSPNMADSLALLCYAESPAETDSMVRELERIGYQAKICTVPSVDDLQMRLSRPDDWHLVVVRRSSEIESVTNILAMIRELAPDLPCILQVAEGDETAIAAGCRPAGPELWSVGQPQLFGPLVARAIERGKLRRRVAELEDALQRTRRLDSVGTLAGAMAHELNNLLTPIMIAAELLEEDEPDSKNQGLLEGLMTSSRRAADAVKQLQRFIWGKESEIRELDVVEMMRELEKLLRFSLPKSIKLEVTVPRTPCSIKGEPAELFQVIMALAANAREAMSEGGKLTVRCEQVTYVTNPETAAQGLFPGDYVRILVSDTGPGMPPEVLARAGEPFFTTRPVGCGLGLGLATSRMLVARHGGVLHVESAAGEGTRVAVHFPAQLSTTAQST